MCVCFFSLWENYPTSSVFSSLVRERGEAVEQETTNTGCNKGNSNEILGKKFQCERSQMLEQATQGGWDVLADIQNSAGQAPEQPKSICPCFVGEVGPGEWKSLPDNVIL